MLLNNPKSSLMLPNLTFHWWHNLSCKLLPQYSYLVFGLTNLFCRWNWGPLVDQSKVIDFEKFGLPHVHIVLQGSPWILLILPWVYNLVFMIISFKSSVLDTSSVSNGSGLPGFGPGQEPPSNRTGQVLAGCYPDRTYTRGLLAGLELDRGSTFTVPATMALIKYLSSDRIMTWSVRRLCIFSCSFTSHCQICDQVNFRRVAVKKMPIFSENPGCSKGTQRIVVRFQIWQQEVKQRVEMHNLRTDHVMIQSELKYLIGAKVVNLKCRVFAGKTGRIATVRFLVW